ncbi:MAG: hypothetical protein OEU32_12175 [Acidimicrobiia bacterium]|nr:hypothetical protein [Acidimicrobiia bacterium]
MAQPQFVPNAPTSTDRYYESPPRRAGSWRADRPGDVVGHPGADGAGLGCQGPDQGYALTLVSQFDDQLNLAEGESQADAVAGALVVALKRASLFGRAPVVHDLRVGFSIWGLLDPDPDPDLVVLRRTMFAGVAHPHHYAARRAIADAASDEVLRRPHQAIIEAAAAEGRSMISGDHR